MFSIMKRFSDKNQVRPFREGDDGGEYLPTPYGRSVAPGRELIEENPRLDSRLPAKCRRIKG